MAILADITNRVRLELGDQPKLFRFNDGGDGSQKSFYVEVKPIEVATLLVKVNGVTQLNPSQYEVEPDIGVIHFKTAPALNADITVTGTSYRYFTDTDIERFVNTAVEQHTHERTDSLGTQLTLWGIPPVEEYPLAILATCEALWALATDAAFDINIYAPDGVVIPRSERYRQLTDMIERRMQQYKELCSSLNIGLWRLEIGILRRISRTTNKLVPVYMSQEIDDYRKPERVYLQNDLKGRSPAPSYVGIYDIAIYEGDSWSAEFDFPFNVANLTWTAQIRSNPHGGVVVATFDIQTLDGGIDGRIRLSLTPDKTKFLPPRAFWDLQATNPATPTFEQTYVRGQVFVTDQVTLS